MDNILELHQVCKTFPRTNFTLDHVSFSIPYGSIMGFVGENGAGKTTTIGCVLNTVSKDSGTIKIFGKELADTDTELKEKIVRFASVLDKREQDTEESALISLFPIEIKFLLNQLLDFVNYMPSKDYFEDLREETIQRKANKEV